MHTKNQQFYLKYYILFDILCTHKSSDPVPMLNHPMVDHSTKTLFALRKHTTPKTADDIRLAVAEYSAKVHQESSLLGGDCTNAYAEGKCYQ